MKELKVLILDKTDWLRPEIGPGESGLGTLYSCCGCGFGSGGRVSGAYLPLGDGYGCGVIRIGNGEGYGAFGVFGS